MKRCVSDPTGRHNSMLKDLPTYPGGEPISFATYTSTKKHFLAIKFSQIGLKRSRTSTFDVSLVLKTLFWKERHAKAKTVNVKWKIKQSTKSSMEDVTFCPLFKKHFLAIKFSQIGLKRSRTDNSDVSHVLKTLFWKERHAKAKTVNVKWKIKQSTKSSMEDVTFCPLFNGFNGSMVLEWSSSRFLFVFGHSLSGHLSSCVHDFFHTPTSRSTKACGSLLSSRMPCRLNWDFKN